MGQQPNIELTLDDAPRSEPEPGAPAVWKPRRPGEITSPDDMPAGGVFGNHRPDPGWMLKLIKAAEFERSAPAIEAVVATVASARASAYGRGPVPDDVEAALTVLGLRADGLPDRVTDELARRRAAWLAKVPHETVKGRSVLDDFERDFLHQPLESIRSGLADQLR